MVGNAPTCQLTLFSGKLYGMASGSTYPKRAIIFEFDPSTGVFTSRFDFVTTDATSPTGDLILKASKFYGMTSGGGAYSGGTIFEWDPLTNIFLKKVEFGQSAANGNTPCGKLILNGDKFYGMASNGGSYANAGVLFEWDPVTNAYSVKHSFDTDGYQPLGSLSFFDNKFYGLTSLGGTNNLGNIFELDLGTNTYSKKLDLSKDGGYNFYGSLTALEGTLYGVMQNGGQFNTGVIFHYDPATNLYQKKIDLDNPTGTGPNGTLTAIAGKLYGMTENGGLATKGVLFEWDPATNAYTKKIDFDRKENGAYPVRSLTPWNGKLYGMASSGGKNDYGTIFELDPATGIYTKRTDLADVAGNQPNGVLMMLNNKFYGITEFGGSGGGSIFEWDPATGNGRQMVDINRVGMNAPYRLIGGLTLYNGKFYGMSHGGGLNSVGTIFEWDPASNTFTKKIDLEEAKGSEPVGILTLYNDKFYGMTFEGGTNTLGGVIFEWDPSTNVYTKKIDFVGLNGYEPYGSLAMYNGKFYGTTHGGGANSSGIIFEWDPSTNLLSKKIEFGGVDPDWYLNGFYPIGTLTLSGDKFYGVTSSGGIYRHGVIFEWDPATNVFAKKADIDDEDNDWFSLSQNLALAPAPAASIPPDACTPFPSILITSQNNNQWIAITDTLGHAVAEINPRGNNLGTVNSFAYLNGGPVREDGKKQLYLDVNLTITPQYQPATPVDVRIYVRNKDFLALKSAMNSNGQPSGITTKDDLAIFKNQDNSCQTAIVDIANPVPTQAVSWEKDYVLTATINSFSSFYISNKAFEALPLSLMEFNGRLEDGKAVLHWKVENEYNTSGFEVEKSMDGIHFATIGFVASSGNNVGQSYSFTDSDPSDGGVDLLHYRLKQQDKDGRSVYSQIVIIRILHTKNFQIFPNPVVSTASVRIFLSSPQQLRVRLVEGTGKTMETFSWDLPSGVSIQPIDVKGLAKGVYFLEITSNNETRRFLRFAKS